MGPGRRAGNAGGSARRRVMHWVRIQEGRVGRRDEVEGWMGADRRENRGRLDTKNARMERSVYGQKRGVRATASHRKIRVSQ